MLSKPDQIAPTDVRLVQFLDNLRAREVPCLIEQPEARDEAELLPALSAFAESSPRALRGESSVHTGAAPILVQVFQLLLQMIDNAHDTRTATAARNRRGTTFFGFGRDAGVVFHQSHPAGPACRAAARA